MSDIKLITARDLKGENPLFPTSQFTDDFILLNMGTEIWLVDKKIESWEQIKESAMAVARMFNDTATIEELNNIK